MSAGFGRRSTAEQVTEGLDLRGRHAVVTGANTGIGFEAARVLALRGADVTLACRDHAKASAAAARIAGAGKLDLLSLDLGSLASVRSAAETLLSGDRPIHWLINNAGVMLPDRRETSDGHEAHFGEVTERYLQYLVDGKPADWEVPNMKAKYYTTTKALEMAK